MPALPTLLSRSTAHITALPRKHDRINAHSPAGEGAAGAAGPTGPAFAFCTTARASDFSSASPPEVVLLPEAFDALAPVSPLAAASGGDTSGAAMSGDETSSPSPPASSPSSAVLSSAAAPSPPFVLCLFRALMNHVFTTLGSTFVRRARSSCCWSVGYGHF